MQCIPLYIWELTFPNHNKPEAIESSSRRVKKYTFSCVITHNAYKYKFNLCICLPPILFIYAWACICSYAYTIHRQSPKFLNRDDLFRTKLCVAHTWWGLERH